MVSRTKERALDPLLVPALDPHGIPPSHGVWTRETRVEGRRRPKKAETYTGCVRAVHAYSGISCGALRLEVSKSPTEVTRGRHVPGSLPSAICEFTSSSSCS
eukprot:scaffold92262_cov82-Phaeocystis_antarctica.AAC.1